MATEPRVPMPTGNEIATADAATNLPAGTTAKHEATQSITTPQPPNNAIEPAKTKKPSRHRRRRTRQTKVCVTAVELQESTDEQPTTDVLTQWMKSLEKESWWPKDQTNTPAANEETVSVNMLSSFKPRRSKRIKKDKSATATSTPASILKHTSSNNQNQGTGKLTLGDGHSRTKCIQYNCPQPTECEAKSRGTTGQGAASAHIANQEANQTREISTQHSTNQTPTKNNNHPTYAQVTSSGTKTPRKYSCLLYTSDAADE